MCANPVIARFAPSETDQASSTKKRQTASFINGLVAGGLRLWNAISFLHVRHFSEDEVLGLDSKNSSKYTLHTPCPMAPWWWFPVPVSSGLIAN